MVAPGGERRRRSRQRFCLYGLLIEERYNQVITRVLGFDGAVVQPM